ncbi:MAG: methyltransferase, partial [Bacteroidota bacterium]
AKFVKNIHVTSIDTSEESLEVARLNAKVHQVEGIVTFLRMDVFEPVDQLLLRRFDVLVSNPPYVSKVDWEGLQLEVRKYEPRAATSDWRDGYEFFRRIVELAPYLLANGGRVAVEVGFGQSDSVSAMMQNAGLSAISVVADLQGVPRVVMGTCHSMVRNPAPLN